VADVVADVDVVDTFEVEDGETRNVGTARVVLVVASRKLPSLPFSAASPFHIMGQEGISTFKLEGTQLQMRRVEPIRIGRLWFVV